MNAMNDIRALAERLARLELLLHMHRTRNVSASFAEQQRDLADRKIIAVAYDKAKAEYEQAVDGVSASELERVLDGREAPVEVLPE